ncbi:hypothetical protein B0H15DRAFT_825533 [Mycena belliarum]|uniref:F-box domain-containing protein n=1 Tax=Mycena belliarum TaxID=1033014 RepID=A0AAD6XQN0_9AGAR|nr:hypothetical protein B0H15DRAFT_825533 [Mycena belliae]
MHFRTTSVLVTSPIDTRNHFVGAEERALCRQRVAAGLNCHIRRLPFELISIVFNFVTENVDHWSAVRAYESLLSCAQTCAAWRDIIMQYPALWAEVVVFNEHIMGGSFIADSGLLSDNVSIALDAIVPPTGPICSEGQGWCTHQKHPNKDYIEKAVVRALQHPAGHHRLALKGPSLTLQSTKHPRHKFDVIDANTVVFARAAPSLCHLRLENFRNAWMNPLLNSLTTLQLNSVHSVSQPALPTVLSALRSCPQLEVLHVRGWELPKRPKKARRMRTPEMAVVLLHLRHLALEGNAGGMLLLLNHLDLPKDLHVFDLICVTGSSRRVLHDIFAYVNDNCLGLGDSEPSEFESLHMLFNSNSDVMLRLGRGMVKILILVDREEFTTLKILNILPLSGVERFTAEYEALDPILLDCPNLWGVLLGHLPAVEWMRVPGHAAKAVSDALKFPQLQTTPVLAPSLSRLLLDWDDPLDWGNPLRGRSTGLECCVASRKDVEGVQPLQVQNFEPEVPGPEFEDTSSNYWLQFVNEEYLSVSAWIPLPLHEVG